MAENLIRLFDDIFVAFRRTDLFDSDQSVRESEELEQRILSAAIWRWVERLPSEHWHEAT